MLQFELKQFMIYKGYKPSPTVLGKIGIGYESARRLLDGRALSISHAHMEALCIFLNCTPNDLYNFKPDSDRQVEPHHVLNKLKKKMDIYDPSEYIKLLNPEQIEQANLYLKDLADKNKANS
jgi:DNA-binding Xre family transcriptional regulator